MSTEKNSGKNAVALMVRLPTELHEKVRNRAAFNHRSLNGEIISLLATAIGTPKDRADESARRELLAVNRRIETAGAELRAGEARRDAIIAEFRSFFGNAGLIDGDAGEDFD